jgi:hypothetical protein
MNKTQTTEQTNTQHLKPITQNDIAQNTGFRKTRLHITEYGIRNLREDIAVGVRGPGSIPGAARFSEK